MSAFSDAIMASMISSMDPNKAMEKEALRGYLDTQKAQLQVVKAQTVREIAQLLDEAQKSDADSVVITTYKNLLESLA